MAPLKWEGQPADPLELLEEGKGNELAEHPYRLWVVPAILYLIWLPQRPSRAKDETTERKVTQWVCGGARGDADLRSCSVCFSPGHCWPLKEAGLEVGASVAEVSVKMRTFQTLGYD